MKGAWLILLGAFVVFSSPAWARAPKRKARKASNPVSTAPKLDEPAFTSILEVSGGPEPDLRDALAPAPAAVPAAETPARPGSLLERLVAERNGGSRRFDAYACHDGARNLRFIVNVAKSDLRDEEPPVARRKFASGLKRELEALQRSQPPEDSEVAVHTTEAEMELESALKELDDRPLRPGTLAAASRAASHLDAAARLLAGR